MRQPPGGTTDLGVSVPLPTQEDAVLDSPRFHHLHLNSVDPDAAIDFYTTHFGSTSRTTWGGQPALASPNDVLILFTRVASPPAIAPETAIWHFGWHVTDTRAARDTYTSRPGLQLLPLYTGEGDGTVFVSSDTWPGTGGVLGRTRAQIAEAKANGVEPTRIGGFGYMQGPDRAIVEYAGNHPAQRFNHVHMWQEDPLCAELWYQQHLNASALPGRSGSAALTDESCKVVRGADLTFPALEACGTYRTPSGGVAFGDVWLPWYMRQGDAPLVSTRGHVYDHFALSVTSLDAWIHKLHAEGVVFSSDIYPLESTRAIMIVGPSLEQIELVEAT
jgi:catechol 2,3-dioxygenase-like lactoylglutathione lyase family enzyme